MKVFDASAVLAILFDEPGAEQARRWLEEDDALISSVNQTEVLSKLLDRGLTTDEMATVAEELPLKVVALTQQQAHQAAPLPLSEGIRLPSRLAGFIEIPVGFGLRPRGPHCLPQAHCRTRHKG